MYSSWFSQEIHLLGGHPAIAAGIILLLAGSESAPVIGAIIPGTVTIIAIAAVVSTSAWTAVLVTIAGALGAILGDCLSFTFGRLHSGWVQQRTKSGAFRRHDGSQQPVFCAARRQERFPCPFPSRGASRGAVGRRGNPHGTAELLSAERRFGSGMGILPHSAGGFARGLCRGRPHQNRRRNRARHRSVTIRDAQGSRHLACAQGQPAHGSTQQERVTPGICAPSGRYQMRNASKPTVTVFTGEFRQVILQLYKSVRPETGHGEF